MMQLTRREWAFVLKDVAKITGGSYPLDGVGSRNGGFGLGASSSSNLRREEMETKKRIQRKGMEMVDYGQPEYLDGAAAQFSVHASDWSWVAHFSDEEDAKAFLAMKSGTKVE